MDEEIGMWMDIDTKGTGSRVPSSDPRATKRVKYGQGHWRGQRRIAIWMDVQQLISTWSPCADKKQAVLPHASCQIFLIASIEMSISKQMPSMTTGMAWYTGGVTAPPKPAQGCEGRARGEASLGAAAGPGRRILVRWSNR